VAEVRQVLGLFNFFRHMIPRFTVDSVHLSQLTRKDSTWQSGTLPPRALQAFQSLKKKFLDMVPLARPRRGAMFHLFADAATGDSTTPGGIGAVLCQQDQQGRMRPISFYARGLKQAEHNYSVYLLEMTSLVDAMKHFRHHLIGRHFTAYSDHKPLVQLKRLAQKTLDRLQEARLEFDCELKYMPGNDNGAADWASRQPAYMRKIAQIEMQTAVPSQVAALFSRDVQELDPLVMKMKKAVTHNVRDALMPKELFNKLRSEGFVDPKDNLLYMRPLKWPVARLGPGQTQAKRLVVPHPERAGIIRTAHGSRIGGHAGQDQVTERIRDHFWWPNIKRDVAAHIAQCYTCQTARETNKQKPPPPLVQQHPQGVNDKVHIDLVGPMKVDPNGAKKFCMVVTCAFSKMATVTVIPDKSCETVATAFVNEWICKYGCPRRIHSDLGNEFQGALYKTVMTYFDIEQTSTAPYHPQANGQSEVFNRTLKRFLTAFSTDTFNWEQFVPALCFSYNTAIHRATALSPFSVVYGYNPNMPYFDLGLEAKDYSDEGADKILKRMETARYFAAKHNLSVDKRRRREAQASNTHIYKEGDLALVWRPPSRKVNAKLYRKWQGPYEVLDFKANMVTLEDGNGNPFVEAAINCKPFVSNAYDHVMDND
ncbi:MAG TPA: hypothetical protein EYO76_10055, partial [Flavobacteriaceae bacterium]|nr:hypothetical protein [Flavobacteriaceae bacterium]